MNEINPYQSPQHASTEAADSSPSSHLQDDTKPGRWHKTDLAFAMGQQAVLLLFTALLLDGGFTFRVCCVAAIAHWAAMGIIRIRRPIEQTTLDVAVVKFGFLFCFIMTFAAALVVSSISALW